MQAFEEAEDYDDELYISALTPIIEISNAGMIPNENEPIVEDGTFIMN